MISVCREGKRRRQPKGCISRNREKVGNSAVFHNNPPGANKPFGVRWQSDSADTAFTAPGAISKLANQRTIKTTGVAHGEFAPAGAWPDTLFHFDQECQLVFCHPDPTPRQVINYRAQYDVAPGKPYPKETVLPALHDWHCVRDGDNKTYTYRIISWYPMPYGLAQWGDFRDWEIDSTNALSAKIVDERILFLRMNVRERTLAPHEINDATNTGEEFWIKLRRR